MPSHTSEKALETTIETYLLEHGGYIKGDPNNFDPELGLDPHTLLHFLQTTQPKEWEKAVSYFKERAGEEVVKRLVAVLKKEGSLRALRKGFQVYDIHFRLAYFKPATTMNPDAQRLYESNILTVTRQVHYSTKNKNSLDMVLFVNGLPVITIELKNPLTNQRTIHAIKQYIQDRDPNEPIFRFKERALVHFAVDTEEAYMTTRLQKDQTVFLPFNKGHNGGKGNPPNPNGIRTSYLWEKIWQKDSLLDIIHRFIHLQSERKTVNGKQVLKETMIFPRYHQLDVVRKLEADAKAHGAGKNYLIQHSAGSGKSNSIAWITHRLAHLHDDQDQPVFDSIIVITDRLVLDKQLQNTIYQFEHAQGLVHKIDDDSNQLANAIQSGAKIIISTIQKFRFIVDKTEEQVGKKFAIIVDEAHSSQTGEAANAVKEVLAAKSLEEAEEIQIQLDATNDQVEEEILRTLSKRGPQSNLSFFAFTATPKNKTLEMFGEKTAKGPKPFHLYSMRQAIEEGFILDVLQNYTTYQMYYRVAKAIEDDPSVDTKKAKRAIARFVSLHPHNLAQKTEVIVEHFRNVVRKKLNGKAKAMVVTSSRLHALRYQQEFKRYIERMGYTDVKTLVAFSGKLNDGGLEYTEEKINGIREKELPEKFATDEYQVLIVADKYQTGFDQPLLHTMYVDKKLSGIQAVQTLSRLNRTYPGKLDTFVLDFVNTQEEIQKAFLPYYEQTTLEKTTDPNLLFDLKNKLDDAQVYWQSEVESFSKIFFKPVSKQKVSDLEEINSYLDPAVDRFKALGEDEQVDFKSSLTSYVRLYSFISQIAPFQSPMLHKLHAFAQMLLRKLPSIGDHIALNLDDKLTLQYYRLEETQKGSISLVDEEKTALKGITAAGTGKPQDPQLELLSVIVSILNDHFGDKVTEADRVFFEQIKTDFMENEKVVESAKNNKKANFGLTVNDNFDQAIVRRMSQNQMLAKELFHNEEFKNKVKAWLVDALYREINEEMLG